MASESLNDLREARYESLTLKARWTALPIGLGLIGLLAFVWGVWSLIKALSPHSTLLTSLAFKWLVFGSGVYLFGSAVHDFIDKGVALQRALTQGVQLQPDGTVAIPAVVPNPSVLWHLMGWAVMLGLGVSLLHEAFSLPLGAALFVWAGAYAWIILHILGRSMNTAMQAIQPYQSNRESPEPDGTPACPAEVDAPTLPLWRIVFVEPLRWIVGLVLCVVAPLYLLARLSYGRLDERGVNFWGVLTTFSELWLSVALVGAFAALILGQGYAYRVLYHTRCASTRWALVLDYLALTTLVAALFLVVGLCWALMR